MVYLLAINQWYFTTRTWNLANQHGVTALVSSVLQMA